MIQPQGVACADLSHRPILCTLLRDMLFGLVMFLMAELLHQYAGVDSHRASEGAASIPRTGLNGVVFVLTEQRLCNDTATWLPTQLAA